MSKRDVAESLRRLDLTPGATLHSGDQGIVVNVPLGLKKHGGRKEVILPETFSGDAPVRPSHREALELALVEQPLPAARADEGKFEPMSGLALVIGLDSSSAKRLLRLMLLAPDIIEAILIGEKPSGLSLAVLMRKSPPMRSDSVNSWVSGTNQTISADTLTRCSVCLPTSATRYAVKSSPFAVLCGIVTDVVALDKQPFEVIGYRQSPLQY